MIQQHLLVTGLSAGASAIVFGLAPGLPQTFVEGFSRLSDALHSQMRIFPSMQRFSQAAPVEQPYGFVLFGLAIIAATLLAYLVS